MQRRCRRAGLARCARSVLYASGLKQMGALVLLIQPIALSVSNLISRKTRSGTAVSCTAPRVRQRRVQSCREQSVEDRTTRHKWHPRLPQFT
jgi:hypothetical protein